MSYDGLACIPYVVYPRLMPKNRRRPQAPKNTGNRAMYDAMMELRRSSATTPVPSGTTYKRKPKHGKWSD